MVVVRQDAGYYFNFIISTETYFVSQYMVNFEESSLLDVFISWIVFTILFCLYFHYLHWGIKCGDWMVSESQPRVVAVGSSVESFCVGLCEIFAPWSQFRSLPSDSFCFQSKYNWWSANHINRFRDMGAWRCHLTDSVQPSGQTWNVDFSANGTCMLYHCRSL